MPEGKELISDISIVGERLFVSGVRGGVTQTRIFTLEGKEMGEIAYPAIGFESSVHHRCSLHSDEDRSLIRTLRTGLLRLQSEAWRS